MGQILGLQVYMFAHSIFNLNFIMITFGLSFLLEFTIFFQKVTVSKKIFKKLYIQKKYLTKYASSQGEL